MEGVFSNCYPSLTKRAENVTEAFLFHPLDEMQGEWPSLSFVRDRLFKKIRGLVLRGGGGGLTEAKVEQFIDAAVKKAMGRSCDAPPWRAGAAASRCSLRYMLTSFIVGEKDVD